MKTKKNGQIVASNLDIRERHRRRQIRKKRVRFTIFCSCVALVLLLSACAIVFLTPWFHVRTVSVVDNAQVKEADLVAASGINKGVGIFMVKLKDVEAALLKVPYVKTVQAKRKLPNKIELQITESHMVARIEQGSMQICIDETGETVFAGANPPKEVVLVHGLSVEAYPMGERVVADENKLKMLLEFIEIAEGCGCLAKMSEVDISNTDRITFVYEERFNVICGDMYNLEQKLLRFLETVRQLKPNAEGEMDLRIENEVHYIP